MPSTVSQVRYTHLGFLLHESRSHLPTAPHAQREIHRGRLIRGTTVFIMFCDVVQLRTALVVTPSRWCPNLPPGSVWRGKVTSPVSPLSGTNYRIPIGNKFIGLGDRLHAFRIDKTGPITRIKRDRLPVDSLFDPQHCLSARTLQNVTDCTFKGRSASVSTRRA